MITGFSSYYHPQRSCDKVMFSQVCVKNSVHGGGDVCMARGGMHGRGACVAEETAITAGGTHPTGMHSCF